MKVALVYDRVNKWGGAERVLLALHKLFPDAPLYTSLHDKENSKWAEVFDIKTSFINSAAALRKYNDLLAMFMPIAFESFSFSEYDLVISVTSEAAKGIITQPKTHHISYILTPTRYLWSGYEDYFVNNLFQIFSNPSVKYLKSWDKIAAKRPDQMIAISSEVRNRIKKYYERDAVIIFPPLLIDKPKKIKKRKQDYFLLVSRLSRFSYYKKVDLAIEAFKNTNYKLIVVGAGPLLKKLKSTSSKNIDFVGEVSDEELASYYSNAKALIFPGLEDFGLVMAEAQFFGTPVIAYKAGGALDIVVPGKTGEFFDKQTAAAIIKTLKRFDESIYNKSDIIENSKRFSYESFAKGFKKLLKDKEKLL